MARPSKTVPFWSISCPHRRRFRVLVLAFRKIYGLSLPFPTFPGSPDERFSSFKGFCSGPMERKKHLWDPYLLSLGKRPRFSIWMSIFLFRKTLPASAPDSLDFLEKISTPSPDVDLDFRDFIEKEINKMFRKGWDYRYYRSVDLAVVSTSASANSKRHEGGCRMEWLEDEAEVAREQFCSYLWEGGIRATSHPSRLESVDTGGKVRILTIPPAQYALLQPLHKTMYDHLSKNEWLLRGDAKPSVFHDFVRKEGEVFISGDYESATDSLNGNVQKEILRCILQNCQDVPNDIRVLAMNSLSGDVNYKDDRRCIDRTVTQRSGQMMGYPLSFPLLCIVNYLAFLYSVKDRTIPVRINGDDIVFRSTEKKGQQWMSDVSRAGLVLSRGKTLVDRSIFTLNSTLFAASESKVKLVPFIRSKALFGKDDSAYSIAGRYSSFAPGFKGFRRRELRTVFIRQNIGYISKSGRSLNRGLGINVDPDVLKRARVFRRECGYLSLPKENPPPVPRSMWNQRPLGYELAYSEEKKIYSKEEKDALVEAVVQSAWLAPSTDEKDFERIYQTGLKIPKMSSKLSSLLTMHLCEACGLKAERYACQCPTTRDWVKKKFSSQNIERMWIRRDEEIFQDYVKRRRKLYPYWKKKQEVASTFDDETENPDNEVILGPIELGPSTVYDCRGDHLKVVCFSAGQKVKQFRTGIGIGPPTSF